MNSYQSKNRLLKGFLKGKMRLTMGIIVSFLITGTMSFAATTTASYTGTWTTTSDAKTVQDDMNAAGGEINQNTRNIGVNAGNIAGNTARITTNTNSINTLTTRTTAVEQKANANETAITGLTTRTTAVENRANTNSINITTNRNDISTNRNNITRNSNDISTNRNNITTNRNDISTNRNNITTNATNITTNTNAINTERTERQEADRLEREARMLADTALENNFNNKLGKINNKLNQGMSLLAAMDAIDFQDIKEGELVVGVGTGHYSDSQAVALGFAYAPTEDLHLNAKYSMTTGTDNEYAAGIGATYKLRFK